MENKFEMGPLQKQWVADLRKYPERQTHGELGRRLFDNSIKACCLGQLLITDCEMNNKELPFNNNEALYDQNTSLDCYLENSYEKYGLIDDMGAIGVCSDENFKGHRNLSQANDAGISWVEIADFIEANPEKVFIKSV